MVTVDGWGPFHLREVVPKDFYLAQIIRSEEGGLIPIFMRILLNEGIIDEVPSRVFKSLIGWAVENILKDNVLTVENWLEVAFHLCKQRWDSSIDWLEGQPMSKIRTMIEINKKHVEEQEAQMKKSSRKR